MASTPKKAQDTVEETLVSFVGRLDLSVEEIASPDVAHHRTNKYSVINVVASFDTVRDEATKQREAFTLSPAATKAKTPEREQRDEEVNSLLKLGSTVKVTGKYDEFIKKLDGARNIIVMVGAGLSVAAGIPDFRTPGTGLYSQLAKYKLPKPEAIFEINYFKRDPQAFLTFATELWPGRKYLPTIGHYFIKLLNDKNKLLRCYTQNIDSLETSAGLPRDKLVAAHGNFDSATCVFTRKRVPIDEVRDAYINKSLDQLNKKHGTLLVKPDIVFFGEELPDRFHRLAPLDFEKCDLLIVMGTSLQVHPFASLICMPRKGVPRMLINRERVGEHMSRGFDFDSAYSKDVFLAGDCDAGCMRLAETMGWTDDLLETAKPKL